MAAAGTGSPSRTALSPPPAPSDKLAAACCFVLLVPFLLLTGGGQAAVAEALSIGVNYGQIANNLPSPARVSWLLRSMRISKVKLYDADPNVLRAFLGTGVEFVVGIGNEAVPSMATSPAAAQAWVQQHVVPHLRSGARIACVTVGNEVFKPGTDDALRAAVLPAMQSVHRALAALGLQGRVNVTTAHSLDIMAASFPPSAGAFAAAALPHLRPFLAFLSATRSPFLINCYPYFAYKADPARVPLDYVLFQPGAAGVADARTGLRYDNMLYAQVDAVYAAIQGMGYTDVEVKVSETGWPSKGDADEPGATPEYAGTYIRNLLRRIEAKQGTPMRPDTPVDVYVFALFNENLKPGPASERNYGLFYPDGTPVYNVVGMQGYLPPMLVSSAGAGGGAGAPPPQVIRWFAMVAIASAALVLLS
ncbi:hypothetical protein U9M48_023244 [Paspalum notatum var. saurae]|uniref:glucan endo-1,3-beta-D-glucosidase n=1 Tax=Paspalum notatum var. saurae TaxID=547442 RepID=A0AAQ3WVL9_PASNO